jgi:hypothetical protein
MAHIRLHVQQAEGHLPMVCMRCGAPATVLKVKKMSWYPRWIIVLIVVGAPGLLLGLILALVLRKTARLHAPLCEDHQGHWTTRLVINWVIGVLAIGLSVGGFIGFIALDSARPRGPNTDGLMAMMCIGSLVAFFGWLIMAAILHNTSIRPDEITRTHILLAGVSETFVDAVEEAEIERRVRLRQMQEEDKLDRPRRVSADENAPDLPPRRSTGSDAFAEDRPRRAPPSDAIEE